MRKLSDWLPGPARKVVIGIVAGTIILMGVALLVLPGPGWLIIFGGFALLATEFAFARRWLNAIKKKAKELKQAVTGGEGGDPLRAEPKHSTGGGSAGQMPVM